MIYAIGAVIGIWAYKLFLNDPKLKRYFIATSFLYAIVQGLYAFVSAEKTLLWFRIEPDTFCFCVSFLTGLCYELQMMPLLVLACALSPKGVETTFYALVISVLNIAYLLGYWLSATLAWAFHVTADDFTHLTLLICTCSLFPLVTSVIILLLPSPNNKAVIQENDSEDKEVLRESEAMQTADM